MVSGTVSCVVTTLHVVAVASTAPLATAAEFAVVHVITRAPAGMAALTVSVSTVAEVMAGVKPPKIGPASLLPVLVTAHDTKLLLVSNCAALAVSVTVSATPFAPLTASDLAVVNSNFNDAGAASVSVLSGTTLTHAETAWAATVV